MVQYKTLRSSFQIPVTVIIKNKNDRIKYLHQESVMQTAENKESNKAGGNKNK
ncbi:MAG: hypothetical protein QXW67_04210 [Candidatus Micrarchaeia archaeon]